MCRESEKEVKRKEKGIDKMLNPIITTATTQELYIYKYTQYEKR